MQKLSGNFLEGGSKLGQWDIKLQDGREECKKDADRSLAYGGY